MFLEALDQKVQQLADLEQTRLLDGVIQKICNPYPVCEYQAVLCRLTKLFRKRDKYYKALGHYGTNYQKMTNEQLQAEIRKLDELIYGKDEFIYGYGKVQSEIRTLAELLSREGTLMGPRPCHQCPRCKHTHTCLQIAEELRSKWSA